MSRRPDKLDYVVIYRNEWAGPQQVETFCSLEAAEGFYEAKLAVRGDTTVILARTLQAEGGREGL